MRPVAPLRCGPDARVTVRRPKSASRRRPRSVAGTSGIVAGSIAVGTPAIAAPGFATAELFPSFFWFDPRSAVGFATLTGLVIFSAVLAIQHIRERRIWTERERRLAAENAGLRMAGDRAELLLGAEPQVIVVWSGHDGEAAIEGDPATLAGGAAGGRLLAFGSWLLPGDAARIESGTDRLRATGEGFRLVLRSAGGDFVEAEGRAVGGRALLRLRDVTGYRSDLLRAEAETTEARDMADALRGLLDAIDEPAWLRGRDGRLRFANRAYAKAVEAADGTDAAARSLELLERSDREEASRQRLGGATFRSRVAAIVSGARRVLDITEAPLPGGSGGIARDVSELESLRLDLQRQMQAHVRTLDQFPTAVAMFDATERLVFHNAAYRRLWDLDAAFLASGPSDGEILDRLRTARRLPEQADFRSWKAGILEAYRSVEPRETWWYLPDRRTLRVVANPNPQGGLTYLFDDVSDRIHLESRYNALIKTQAETLNTLSEGVALFGADGRLRLHNRAFREIWRMDEAALDGEPHVEAVLGLGRPLAPTSPLWTDLRGAVAGFSTSRETVQARMERLDGTILDCAAEPMPGGLTLLTFKDVTASVNVERALTDRNDALEKAARLRDEFVHHVSYELRTPLTNIIGFAELIGAETIGELNERQRDYAGHILQCSGALLAIINDILDLASIDADTVELSREPVDIRAAIDAAAAGIGDRLAEDRLHLVVDVPREIGTFVGDTARVRQIVFNLLSNAAGFSSAGQTIRVLARRTEREVVVTVADEGSGIPPEVQARVFERFTSHSRGTAHRGVGLGLSIVRSFVELHGGRVDLLSVPGQGTIVTCHFPAEDRPQGRIAAE